MGASLYNTIATYNNSKANDLLRVNGIRVRQGDVNQTAIGLAKLVTSYGKPAMKEIAKLHPDADFIAQNIPNSSFSNCDGGCSKCKMSNADGETNVSDIAKPQPSDVKAGQLSFFKEYKNMIFAVSALAAIVLIVKYSSNK